MIMTNKILAVALITALIGASLGAAVMHSRDTGRTAETTTTVPNSALATNDGQDVKYSNVTDPQVPAEFTTAQEQNAYKIGFTDGFQAAEKSGNGAITRSAVYRSTANRSSSRRVYYDYSKPQGRSFWSKHRDKLTMAMGAGGGALIGGLIGGRRGAGIGTLAGLGGSALYTYKLRHRNHR
jgi:hypothetical protein